MIMKGDARMMMYMQKQLGSSYRLSVFNLPECVKIALVKLPPVRTRVFAHSSEQEVDNAWLDPIVLVGPVDIAVEREGHVVHPTTSSCGRHHRCGVVVMMKLDTTVTAMILPTASECIDPVRRLCSYVVLYPGDTCKGVAEPWFICERLTEMRGVSGQMRGFTSRVQRTRQHVSLSGESK